MRNLKPWFLCYYKFGTKSYNWRHKLEQIFRNIAGCSICPGLDQIGATAKFVHGIYRELHVNIKDMRYVCVSMHSFVIVTVERAYCATIIFHIFCLVRTSRVPDFFCMRLCGTPVVATRLIVFALMFHCHLQKQCWHVLLREKNSLAMPENTMSL